MVETAGRTGYRGQGAIKRSRHPLWLIIAVALLLPGLANCQGAPAPTLAAAAPPVHPAEASPPPATKLPSRTPSQTPTPLPSATATTTPSATPAPTVTPTPTELPTVRHLRIFDQLYDLVLQNYLYPDFNGLNWLAWGAVYRELVAAGMTDTEFHGAMAELIGKLDDGHSTFQSPAAAGITNAIIHGQHQNVGIGVEIASRPERNTAVLLDVYPNGPAWNAGLRAHDSLLTLDERPILEQLAQLDGPVGSTVRLTAQTPGELPRPVEITRALIDSPPPVSALRWDKGDIVTIIIRTFWDQNTASLLRRRLQEMGDQGIIGGLIIDLRINHGGSEYSLERSLRLFADGTLGYFTRRNGERPLIVTGEHIHNSQNVPLVILIGKETSSYAEIFAGVLQSIGRARLVGTVTRGNVETIWPHDFEDHSRVWIAEEGFRPLGGGNWEGSGIVPDFSMPGDWADFTAENDTQLDTALQLLRQNNP